MLALSAMIVGLQNGLFFEKNSHLSEEQKNIIEQNIPPNLRWRAIPLSEFENYDWQRLITLTRDFIAENTALYEN